MHPTIDLHRELAALIVDSFVEIGLVPAPPTSKQIADVDASIKGAIDIRRQGVAFRNLAKVLHWSGKYDEAARNARNAMRLLPTDLESRYVLADCLAAAGEEAAALREYATLFEIGDFDRAFLPYGELLSKFGRHTSAKAYLTQAIFVTEGRRLARALKQLGTGPLEVG